MTLEINLWMLRNPQPVSVPPVTLHRTAHVANLPSVRRPWAKLHLQNAIGTHMTAQTPDG